MSKQTELAQVADTITVDSGNVGIGTSSPTSISGYTGATLNNATNGGFIDLQNNGTTAFRLLTNGSVNNIETRTATPIVFLTNATEAMRIDSVGRVTTPSQPAFRAYKSNGTISSNNVIVLFNDVDLNIGSAYSSSTGRFTAPVAGNYMFNVQGICGVNTGTLVNGTLELQQNGVLLHRGHYNHDNRWENVSYSAVVNMSVNDYVDVKFVQGAGSPTLYGLDKYTSFSGYLLG